MASFEEIKNYWIRAGQTEVDKDGLRPTARDPHMQYLNDALILARLNQGSTVIDVGCGDGVSTVRWLEKCDKVVGVDYSPTLIEMARRRSAQISFQVCDVLDLGSVFKPSSFDAVITTRLLINLPTSELQFRALEQLFLILKPGGVLFLSEGYQDGWDGLNLRRLRHGLDPIKLVDYNRLLQNRDLESFLKLHGKILDFIGFGEYLFGSRVVHPLLKPGQVRHDSEINKIYAEIQLNDISRREYEDCAYAGIFIVEKR